MRESHGTKNCCLMLLNEEKWHTRQTEKMKSTDRNTQEHVRTRAPERVKMRWQQNSLYSFVVAEQIFVLFKRSIQKWTWSLLKENVSPTTSEFFHHLNVWKLHTFHDNSLTSLCFAWSIWLFIYINVTKMYLQIHFYCSVMFLTEEYCTVFLHYIYLWAVRTFL